jgi:hypothetical protein
MAKLAALATFAKVAGLLAELLPVGGGINAGTVRNRTRHVGEHIARLRPAGASDSETDAVTRRSSSGLMAAICTAGITGPNANLM